MDNEKLVIFLSWGMCCGFTLIERKTERVGLLLRILLSGHRVLAWENLAYQCSCNSYQRFIHSAGYWGQSSIAVTGAGYGVIVLGSK